MKWTINFQIYCSFHTKHNSKVMFLLKNSKDVSLLTSDGFRASSKYIKVLFQIINNKFSYTALIVLYAYAFEVGSFNYVLQFWSNLKLTVWSWRHHNEDSKFIYIYILIFCYLFIYFIYLFFVKIQMLYQSGCNSSLVDV